MSSEQPFGADDAPGSEQGVAADQSGSPAPSMVERMTLIMEAFGTPQARLRLDDIVEHAQLPRSTAHRITQQLVRLGWIRHTSGGYALGKRALQLAGGGGDNAELRAAAVPLLQDLSARTDRVVHLGVLDFAEVVYLDRIGGLSGRTVPSRVGARAPAHATALGKGILAWLPPEEVDTLLDGSLKRRTHHTIVDVDVLHQELRRIRSRHGLAFDQDECTVGISCVGAAVRGPEGVVAAVSVCGETRSGGLERIAPVVLDVAQRISAQLYPDAAPEDMASSVWSDGMMEKVLGLIDDDAIM